MSQQNVEIVREVIDLLNAAVGAEPSPRLFELIAADVEVDMSRRTFNPDVYHGHEGLYRLRREVQEVWDAFATTPERIVDAGDRVVVIETHRGRGKGSGVEVENRAAVIWTLRGGQVVQMEVGIDPEEALAAVRARD